MNGDELGPGEELAWTKFRPGTLPCVACGVVVSAVYADRLDRLENIFGGFGALYLDVTRCEVCWQIRMSAVDLLRAHPDVKRALGSDEHALYLLESALGGLDVLGIDDHRVIDRYTGTGAALRRLIDKMAVPGAAAQWYREVRRRPVTAGADTPPSWKRWGHVGTTGRAALQQARVSLFIESNEKPKLIGIVDDRGRPSGCLLCGVGEVETVPSQAAESWVRMEADPGTIGGTPTPAPIKGVVCLRCDDAIDWAGGVGWTAMERSVLVYLGAQGVMGIDAIDGLRGWGTLPGATPNAEPWQHVDLSGMREYLAMVGAPLHGDYRTLLPAAMPQVRRPATAGASA